MDQVEKAFVPKTESTPLNNSLRAQYERWTATIAQFQKGYPGIITEIISPDVLNNGLTLEKIDERWEELQRTAEPLKLDMYEMYEAFRDYLVKPRIIDTYDDTPNGHSERRKFREKLNLEFYEAYKNNDWRLGPMAGVLGMMELYAIITHNQVLLKEHEAIILDITDPEDPDKKEIYSTMTKEQKSAIAGRVRKMASEIFFSKDTLEPAGNERIGS